MNVLGLKLWTWLKNDAIQIIFSHWILDKHALVELTNIYNLTFKSNFMIDMDNNGMQFSYKQCFAELSSLFLPGTTFYTSIWLTDYGKINSRTEDSVDYRTDLEPNCECKAADWCVSASSLSRLKVKQLKNIVEHLIKMK